MAISETTVKEQLMAEDLASMRNDIMRLKQLVRDYDDALEYAILVQGPAVDAYCARKYDRLNERAKELGAIAR